VKSRPITAPVCATSRAIGPSRSSRAINEACNAAGTPAAAGAVADNARSTPSRLPCASITARASSSTNNGTPSARSTIFAASASGNARSPAIATEFER
jgi:hypothetical protein